MSEWELEIGCREKKERNKKKVEKVEKKVR